MLTKEKTRRKIVTNQRNQNRGARKVSKDGCIREPLAGVNAAAQNLPNGLARAARKFNNLWLYMCILHAGHILIAIKKLLIKVIVLLVGADGNPVRYQ